MLGKSCELCWYIYYKMTSVVEAGDKTNANEKDLSTALETLDVGKVAETSTSEIGTDEILTGEHQT